MSTPPGLLLLTENSKKKTLIKNKENIDPNFTYKNFKDRQTYRETDKNGEKSGN